MLIFLLVIVFKKIYFIGIGVGCVERGIICKCKKLVILLFVKIVNVCGKDVLVTCSIFVVFYLFLFRFIYDLEEVVGWGVGFFFVYIFVCFGVVGFGYIGTVFILGLRLECRGWFRVVGWGGNGLENILRMSSLGIGCCEYSFFRFLVDLFFYVFGRFLFVTFCFSFYYF